MQHTPLTISKALNARNYLIASTEIFLLAIVSVVAYDANENDNLLINEILLFVFGFIAGFLPFMAKNWVDRVVSGDDYKNLPPISGFGTVRSRRNGLNFSDLQVVVARIYPIASIVTFTASVVFVVLNTVLYVTGSIVFLIAYLTPGLYLLVSITAKKDEGQSE